LGKDANVFLCSAELAAVTAILGRIPTPSEYMDYAHRIDEMGSDLYRYLNFDQLPEFTRAAEEALTIIQ